MNRAHALDFSEKDLAILNAKAPLEEYYDDA